jgi:hypothetical protein
VLVANYGTLKTTDPLTCSLTVAHREQMMASIPYEIKQQSILLPNSLPLPQPRTRTSLRIHAFPRVMRSTKNVHN